MRRMVLGLLSAALMAAVSADARAVDKVEHPFLLWTKSDLAAIRKKIETAPWARDAYRRPPSDPKRQDGEDLRQLFDYAVMGDRQAGDIQKKRLLSLIESPHPLGAALEYRILAYDLLYDDLTAPQRAAIEQKFRAYIRYAIKPGGAYDTSVYNNELNYARYDAENGRYTRTNWLPNIIFPWKISANLAAAVLRDENLIRETWATHGSIQWYLDEYLGDSGFYGEELSKMTSTPGGLLLYGTALQHLGLKELGFGYRGKGGATLRGHIESVLRFTFPGVDTGADRWRFERFTAGDVRPWLPLAHATVEGYFPNGLGGDPMWRATGAYGGTQRGRMAQWDGYSGFTPKMTTRLWFEWGHALWPDAGFDWFLAQMRPPDADRYVPTLYFGLDPIDPSAARPPEARSAVYPDRGFVMLRAQEGPGHWRSPAPAACLRLTVPYAHHVNDALALCGFYAFNRPIYQNPKSDPGYAFKFSRSVRSHCSVMVDGHIKKDDWGNTGSLEPAFTDDCITRQDFNDEVKFVAARTSKRYPGVDETRALMLTRQYLFDAYSGRGAGRHSYVRLVHTFGEATPDRPAAWNPSDDLADLVKELADVRTLETGGRPWSVTVRQVPPKVEPADSPLGAAWWARKIGVRLHALGLDGAKAHVAATPKPYSKGKRPAPEPLVDGVTIVESVWGPSATFVALHEPFEGEPCVESFRKTAATDDALAVRVTGKDGAGFDDRLLVRFGEKADEPATLAGDGERFVFVGHGFLRADGERLTVRGGVRSFTIAWPGSRARVRVNGKDTEARVADGKLSWPK